MDSPKIKPDYFRDNALESPKLVAGLRNLHLDDHNGMDESGYYSPGEYVIKISLFSPKVNDKRHKIDRVKT